MRLTAVEKATGQPFIYGNSVVKFRDIAMRGPWTSGGIEANYGIIGGPRGVGWRIAAIEEYGFSPAVLERVLVAEDYSFDMLKRFSF